MIHFVQLNSEGFMGLEPQKVTPSTPMYQWLVRVSRGVIVVIRM